MPIRRPKQMKKLILFLFRPDIFEPFTQERKRTQKEKSMFKSNVSEHPTRFVYISIQGRMIHWRAMEQYSVISKNFAFAALTSWLFYAVRSLTCACAQNCHVHLSVSLYSPRPFLRFCLLRYLLFLRFSC